MRIEINLKIFIIIILFIFLHNLDTYLIFLIFIILHELAHLLFGLIIGGRPKTICLNPLGISLEFYSYKKGKTLSRIILLLAGPFVNLLFASIFMKFEILPEFREKIIYTNLALAIFNLIPILPLDGGKIMLEIIKIFYNSEISNNFMIIFSKTFLMIITLIYSILILKMKNIIILVILIYLWVLFFREEKKHELYLRVKKSLDGKYWNIMWLVVFYIVKREVMKKVVFALIAIILISIFITLIMSISNGIKLSKVNAMYEDIDILDDKIAIFYLDYGYIPVKEVVNFDKSINPNDNNIFYEIDIQKLDNIYLNYGRKNINNNDFYIINEQSHTIYYFEGIEYNSEKIYTRDINYTLVDLK